MQEKQQKIIYAFDFDGVICDSAVETSITGWKVAKTIWQDMTSPHPSQRMITDFREIRPQLETGYEAILIMRLLHLGQSVSDLCANYTQLIANLIQLEALRTDDLKKLFGETRDQWIDTDEEEWLSMNPLFPSVTKQLHDLVNTADSTWYIITTKQERFVKRILQANQIEVDAKQLFGMDRQMTKQETLLILLKDHPGHEIVFIEDRLQTLLGIVENEALKEVSLQLVSWGYNTLKEREIARANGIEIISD